MSAFLYIFITGVLFARYEYVEVPPPSTWALLTPMLPAVPVSPELYSCVGPAPLPFKTPLA